MRERQMACKGARHLPQDALEEAQRVWHHACFGTRRSMSAVPVHLQEPLGSFVAEEVVSSIRHSVVNDLTALAALCYRLKIEHVIQLHDEAAARSAHDLLENIQAYVKRASRRLEVSFVPAAPAAPNAVDATAVLRALVARMPPPVGIEIEGPGEGVMSIRMDGGELELALACLLGNAYEALAGERGGRIRLRCAEGPHDTIQIDVEHDGLGPWAPRTGPAFEPFFSTKPGRLGLGLIARRRAAGAAGSSSSRGLCPASCRACPCPGRLTAKPSEPSEPPRPTCAPVSRESAFARVARARPGASLCADAHTIPPSLGAVSLAQGTDTNGKGRAHGRDQQHPPTFRGDDHRLVGRFVRGLLGQDPNARRGDRVRGRRDGRLVDGRGRHGTWDHAAAWAFGRTRELVHRQGLSGARAAHQRRVLARGERRAGRAARRGDALFVPGRSDAARVRQQRRAPADLAHARRPLRDGGRDHRGGDLGRSGAPRAARGVRSVGR